MEERNPEAVCAKCPVFMPCGTAGGGQCRKHYEEATPGRPGGFMYVYKPAEEFCTDHPEWKLIEGA